MSPIGFAEVDLKISSVVISLQSVLMQLISRYLALVIQSGGKSSLGNNGRVKRMREGHFGAPVLAPLAQRRRFGAGHLGAVPFRRRTFRRSFLIYFYFSSYEEKTMKQAIP